MSKEGVELIPSAKRLAHSMRDMGYEFAAAVADLIDNSIEARASTVRVDVVWDGENSHVLIADNGKGMSPSQLREALRYGAERAYDTDDLGKFGLGLKTASTSQCSRLTVASRQSELKADISAYRWDLDHVGATNRWEILPIRPLELPEAVVQHLKETTGTVVIWEKLDRILNYKNPDGEVARKQLHQMCRELEEHLAMVFHRFLAGQVRGKRLAIYLNNNKVMPWDPFARDEPNTKALDSVSIPMAGHQGKSDVVIEPYVLPPQSKFSSPEAFNRTSGPNKWNRQQGFYIYRADRMIQSGGWSNLRTLDEHLKLARIALFFSPKLDSEFKINVPKMRVSLPTEIRDEVMKAIGPATKMANADYRSGEKASSGGGALPTSSSGAWSGTKLLAREPSTGRTTSERETFPRPALESATGAEGFDYAAKLLEKVATPDELPVVKRVLARAKASLRR
jgi:hypothetical protein